MIWRGWLARPGWASDFLNPMVFWMFRGVLGSGAICGPWARFRRCCRLALGSHPKNGWRAVCWRCGGIAPPGRLCRLRHVAKRYGCFAFSAWPNRLLGEAMCRGRSPGEPREAWRGAAPAPWGFLFRPLWGPGAAPSRQVPRFWLLVTWPQASLCCRRGGRREAVGEPRRGALHPVRRFFRGDRVVHSPHGF